MFYKNLIGNNGHDFPIERFKTIIDEVRYFKPFISITSTEPLLYPYILDAVEYVVKSGLKINITTNGFLLKRYASDLVKKGLQRLTVSLDGPQEIHDSIRGVSGSYRNSIEGIQALDSYKKLYNSEYPQIFVNTTILDINASHLLKFMRGLPLKMVHQVGFMTMVFCTKELACKHNAVFGDRYLATETCLSGGMNPNNIDVDDLFDELCAIKSKFGDKAAYFFKLDRETLRTYFQKPDEFINGNRCVFPWYTAQITSSGNMVGLTRCYNNSFGNIIDDKFANVWNGEKMRKFRLDLKRHKRFPACTRCEGVLYL